MGKTGRVCFDQSVAQLFSFNNHIYFPKKLVCRLRPGFAFHFGTKTKPEDSLGSAKERWLKINEALRIVLVFLDWCFIAFLQILGLVGRDLILQVTYLDSKMSSHNYFLLPPSPHCKISNSDTAQGYTAFAQDTARPPTCRLCWTCPGTWAGDIVPLRSSLWRGRARYGNKHF